ncbi:hypothetical protein KJE20_04979 [Pyrenophora tritici-repentis]|uniref:Uncharacterized protein n=1 Tax=Pyrenophora tritici-repentis TaxID=45151 RepID=A0A922SWJ1_9PLEO|nr:hypothetical protein Ptr86124_011567 [Pyrenophora tritici-repentis]KAI1684695.1 hypothetical protein KJE20_04979 [Pyrenophora tritici-repentis]
MQAAQPPTDPNTSLRPMLIWAKVELEREPRPEEGPLP